MDIFSEYYQTNFWQDDESASGHGSNMQQTAKIRHELPILFRHLGIDTLLDIPCGDFHWFSEMWPRLDLRQYIGGDCVPELIHANREKYDDPKIEFQRYDITRDRLPEVDLILVRDLLGHFSNRDVKLAIENMRKSGSKYLLSTTFPNRENIPEISTGQWRPINLASMFGLPDPLMLVNEGCTEGQGKFEDKSLGLWLLNPKEF